jgi:hypothetical protein
MSLRKVFHRHIGWGGGLTSPIKAAATAPSATSSASWITAIAADSSSSTQTSADRAGVQAQSAQIENAASIAARSPIPARATSEAVTSGASAVAVDSARIQTDVANIVDPRSSAARSTRCAWSVYANQTLRRAGIRTLTAGIIADATVLKNHGSRIENSTAIAAVATGASITICSCPTVVLCDDTIVHGKCAAIVNSATITTVPWYR